MGGVGGQAATHARLIKPSAVPHPAVLLSRSRPFECGAPAGTRSHVVSSTLDESFPHPRRVDAASPNRPGPSGKHAHPCWPSAGGAREVACQAEWSHPFLREA